MIHRDPDYPWMLTSSHKRRRRIGGGREPLFPEEPQKGPAGLTQPLKAAPLPLYPPYSPAAAERVSTEPKMLV
jgi:hypothetical protein